MNFFGKIFKTTFLFVFLIEIFSFLAYLYPLFNQIAFFVILGVVLILTLSRLEYGLYIALAELFIGSKGYLFYFDAGEFSISLRIGLFLVIMSVWLLELIKKRDFNFRKSQFFWWYLAFFIILIGGVINGYLNGNSFNNIFFDANGFLYFALIFVFYEVITSGKEIKNILEILAATILTGSLKTLFLIFAFTHNFAHLSTLYYWIKTTGVAEITQMTDNFSRIFFQSHLYLLTSIFLFISLLILPRVLSLREFHQISGLAEKNNYQRIFGFLVLSFAMIIISFSRSFWLGGIIGLLSLFYFLVFVYKKSFKELSRAAILIILTIIVSVGLITSVINFPWPRGQEVGLYSGSLIAKRATTVKDEVGVDSRWNLLPILLDKIEERPLLGSGFGTTITYRQASFDPKKPAPPYTTFAFEWGYLDTLTKIGCLGLAIYMILIAKIGWLGYKLSRPKLNQDEPASTQRGELAQKLSLGLLLGLIVVLATNAVSPYLNHPLGIGYIILSSVTFETIYKKKRQLD